LLSREVEGSVLPGLEASSTVNCVGVLFDEEDVVPVMLNEEVVEMIELDDVTDVVLELGED